MTFTKKQLQEALENTRNLCGEYMTKCKQLEAENERLKAEIARKETQIDNLYKQFSQVHSTISEHY